MILLLWWSRFIYKYSLKVIYVSGTVTGTEEIKMTTWVSVASWARGDRVDKGPSLEIMRNYLNEVKDKESLGI